MPESVNFRDTHTSWRGRLRALVIPSYPPDLAEELTIRQYERVRQLVPVLYLAIAVIAVSAGIAARHNLPLIFQTFLPVFFVAVSVLRFRTWRKRLSEPVTYASAKLGLKGVFLAAIPMSAAGALLAVLGFQLSDVDTRTMPPMFISLAVFACANCLSSYPKAASTTILVGLLPIVIAMLWSGDHAIAAIAITIAVVALLQMRFVSSQFSEMVQNIELQKATRKLAETDPLTGLSNRRAFTNGLSAMLERKEEPVFGVAMIDLDGFKPANDRYGHAVGDTLLIEVANRLRTLCANDCCVARIGGDEFAVIFQPVRDDAALMDRAAAIRSVLALPYAVDSVLVPLSASVGLACFPREARTIEGLLKAADRALYAEKPGADDSSQQDAGMDGQTSLFG